MPFPDFLVISPAKTASTWLADNLRCHPEVFVPAIKEVKYFSYYSKWLDLSWYLDQFSAAGGRVKGEASPSYAILPVETIRQIRSLMPNLKLVFLMREPIARSWSHAKHNFRYHEANFLGNTCEFEAVSPSLWRENFLHEWPLASGDYLGQLRRWLSVFPRQQIYVDFYESVVHDPQKLLRNLFAFLGVTRDVDLSAFPFLGEDLLRAARRASAFPGTLLAATAQRPNPGAGILPRRTIRSEFAVGVGGGSRGRRRCSAGRRMHGLRRGAADGVPSRIRGAMPGRRAPSR